MTIKQKRAIWYAQQAKKVEARKKHYYDVFPNERPFGLYENMTRHGAKYKAWCKRVGEQPRIECL